MAGEFDDIFNSSDKLEGTDYTFVDADTLRGPDGESRYRIQGFDAPEIAKVKGDEVARGGTAGGGASTQIIQKLAADHGFRNVVKTGQVDPNGREIIKITDDHGRDFTNTILKTGVLDTNRYSSNQDVLSADVASVLRDREEYQDTDWDKGRDALHQAIEADTFYDAGFKRAAVTEQELAHGGPNIASNYVEFRKYDRSLKNKANNPLSESFDLGFRGAQEAMWGAINLVGETSDWDWAKDIGEAGVYRAQAGIKDKPELKLSALDDDGNWDIKGVGEFFQFLGNNAAVSLPYMAATIGGTLLAPVTGGLSLSLPVSIYTGQTWNEMEGEKNAGVAVVAGVTQAVLDRIGLKGIVGGTILKKGTRDAAISKIIADSGNTLNKKQASDLLGNLTRKEIANLAGDIGKVSAEQLGARNLARSLIASGAKGGATEGITEAAQESVGYLAAVAGSDKEFNAVDFNNRIINATIAGTSLGTGFAVPGTAYDAGAWADLAVRQAPAEAKRRSIAGQYAQDEIDKNGRVKSIQELNEENTAAAARRQGDILSFDERVAAHKRAEAGKDVFAKSKDLWASVPGLWKGATRFIFGRDIQNKSRAARVLADMYNGNLQKTFSGSHFENRKHHLLTEYRNYVPDPASIADALGDKRFRSKIAVEKRNAILNQFGQWVKSQEANASLDWNTLPANLQEHRAFLGAYNQQLVDLGNKLHADQAKYNPDLGYVKNYLQHYKSFNKAAIEKDRNKFVEQLVTKGVPRDEARSITDHILGADTVNGPNDFHIGRGKQIPGSHRARTLNLSDDANFQEFMEQDQLANISNAAKSAARYVSYQEFVGDNSSKVNELLQQMLDEGVSEAEVNKVAAGMQDYLDAESGNYKRIKNENWNAIQQNLMFWTMLAGLPLATISSFVELMLTSKSLTKDQIFSNIKNAAVEGAQGMWGKLKVFDSETNKQLEKNKRQSKLKELGYFNWEVGAAHTTGVSETSHNKQRLVDVYFRSIQLQQWTDYTRNVRGSMAGDFVINHLETIATQRNDGALYNNEVQEAEEQLRNLGINVDDMINVYNQQGPLSPAQEQQFADNMREATFNFINEAVALPQSANRPLFYQNPHLALFTQFQGFIATFTANHIPKLWGELVKRGTPSMKYNAFAVMTTMLAMGFVSQYLKDLLKYGKPSEHLDDAEKLQRAVGASGLLGSGERVFNFFFPIYESSSDGPAEWFFNTVTGEAAAASNVSRAGQAIGELASGNTEKGTYQLLKTAPFLGPINQLNDKIANTLFG